MVIPIMFDKDELFLIYQILYKFLRFFLFISFSLFVFVLKQKEPKNSRLTCLFLFSKSLKCCTIQALQQFILLVEKMEAQRSFRLNGLVVQGLLAQSPTLILTARKATKTHECRS